MFLLSHQDRIFGLPSRHTTFCWPPFVVDLDVAEMVFSDFGM